MKPGSKVLCPFHPDQNPSLYIDEDGWAYCFACGWNGTIVDVMAARGYEGPDLLFKQDEFLRSEGWRADKPTGGGIVRPTLGWEAAYPGLELASGHLDKVRARWEFLFGRGYREETLIKFKTHSWNGIVFGWPADGDKWVTRWRSDWFEKKYLYDTGFSRASLYAPDPQTFVYETAVLVEGLLDAAKVWQAGYHNVVATLGGPTLSQCRQLKGFKRVLEMFDNDEGGDAHRRILEREGVTAVKVPYSGGDPGDRDEHAIQAALQGV